jgi:hypothetical protein
MGIKIRKGEEKGRATAYSSPLLEILAMIGSAFFADKTLCRTLFRSGKSAKV